MEGFKVVIVGGGSSHTPGIIQSLIANLDRFPLKKLVLYDIDPDRLELVDTLWNTLRAALPDLGDAPAIPQQSSLF